MGYNSEDKKAKTQEGRGVVRFIKRLRDLSVPLNDIYLLDRKDFLKVGFKSRHLTNKPS